MNNLIEARKLKVIEKYIKSNGLTKEWVLWSNILCFIENKGTGDQKESLHLILSSRNHAGTIIIRDFVYQFLNLTKDKITGKTDENLLFNLFASIDTSIL
jgi:hypothetical protein